MTVFIWPILRLYQYAENIRAQDNFEDDFTIVEVAFG